MTINRKQIRDWKDASVVYLKEAALNTLLLQETIRNLTLDIS
jgi:hypothetical protein